MSWQNQKGSSNLGESASPRGEVFDRLNYAEFLDWILKNFVTSNHSFEIVCRDSMRHYKDATLADALHFYDDMNAWAEDFIVRIQTEAIKKGENELFSETMLEFRLEESSTDSYESLLGYSHRVSMAVRAAEGYGRKIGLLISERTPQAIPFDRAFQMPEAE